MENIIIVSHSTKQCGVYQYGVNVASALKNSTKYKFHYVEPTDYEDFINYVVGINPVALLINYHPATLPWLDRNLMYFLPYLRYKNIKTFGMYHEVTQVKADRLQQNFFDFNLCADPTLKPTNNRTLVIPRLIVESWTTLVKPVKTNEIFTVSSFGFPFKNKKFDRLVKQVNFEYDEALIKLNLPFNHAVGPDGAIDSKKTLEELNSIQLKPGVRLQISHEFLDTPEILKFLNDSDVNCFLYDRLPDRGCSSCTDYALGVKVPIVLSDSEMFRHITSVRPELILGNSTIKEIVAKGLTPLEEFYNIWSEESFIKAIEEVFSNNL